MHRLPVLMVCTIMFLMSTATSAESPVRARDLGIPFNGTPGPFNAITDVAGVAVGALAEDAAGADVTSMATIAAAARSVADFVVRGEGVLAGLPIAEAVLHVATAGDLQILARARDGDLVQRGEVVLTVAGPTRALLAGERTALNLLCHLSGVATLTARWVDAIADTGAAVRDTRKTTAGLRALEKYAVRCGGGVNHHCNNHDRRCIQRCGG